MIETTTLIIDGIWARPRRWQPLCRRIESRIGPAKVFEYDSSGRLSFDRLGRLLADEVHQLGSVNVVAFSMGGLVARAAHLLEPNLPLRRAVFLNSPHRGSWLAYLLPFEGVRQMRPRDEFIQRITEAVWPFPTLCIWNPLDTMVVPGWYTKFNAASREQLCSIPIHIWPIWSRSIHRQIVEFLGSEKTTLARQPAGGAVA